MADVKLSQLAAVSPASVAAGATLWTMPGHIEGLVLERTATNALRVNTGTAFIQSLGYAINVATAITKTGLTLTLGTWYHVYLFMNGANPDIEIVTTAPAAAYSGTARSKSGATTHRYLGSFQAIAANTLPNFLHADGYINYQEDSTATTFRALSNGMATTSTSVSLLNFGVPVTARMAKLNLTNLSTDQTARASNPDASTTSMQGARPLSGWPVFFPLNASQQMTYFYPVPPSGGGLYLDVIGYALER